jgi:alpha-L-rhamnosidase
VGLREAKDWPGAWISTGRQVDAPQPPLLNDAFWIRHAADGSPDPGGYRRWFRKTFEAGEGATAELVMSGDDQFAAWINGTAVLSSNGWQPAAAGDVSGALRPGTNEITVNLTNHQGTGSLIGVLRIREGESEQLIPTDASWGAQLDPASAWEPCHVTGPYGCQPWGAIQTRRTEVFLPAGIFRQEFLLEEKPVFAVLFASALGIVSPRINGQLASDQVLAPGWTDYNKRVHAAGMDVTGLLKKGANCLAASLGDGWHSGYLAFTGRRRCYSSPPALRLALICQMTDGSRKVVATDDAWTWSTGAVQANDLLMGTDTELGLAAQGWDSPDFKSDWSPVVVEKVDVPIHSHPAGAPRRQGEHPGKSVKTEPSRVQFDFGRNRVGWAKIKIKGKPGQKITLRHAEMLDGGELYTVNLRSARSTDTFVLAGSGVEVCEPEFTFHGFRYAEASSDQPFEVVGEPVQVLVHTDMEKTFAFSTSNPLLDALIENSRTSLEGNGLDIFTDCPQRDERAGWTGDAQVYAKTSHYLGDVAAITDKYLTDLLQDTQNEQGALGDVAPYAFVVSFGNAAWEDAGMIMPWTQWQMTGDLGSFEANRDPMKRFADHLCANRDADGLRPAGSYGDWLLLEGPQHSQLLATLWGSQSMARYSELLTASGEDSAAAWALKEARDMRDAVLRAFQQEDGRLVEKGQESQSFYSLFVNHALTSDPSEVASAAGHLVRLLESRKMTIATGFMGTSHLLPGLQKAGRSEDAYRVLLNEEFPGWLFQIKCGATSMWERWDSWHPERGFQDAGMNSFNHFWIGCVGEWMMGGILGIQPAKPGFEEVLLAPQPTRQMGHASGTYESVRGPIASSWKWEGDSLLVKGSLPAATKGRLELPGQEPILLGPGSFEARV